MQRLRLFLGVEKAGSLLDQSANGEQSPEEKYSFLQACALNTMMMFGTGPYISIPFCLAATSPPGPQAISSSTRRGDSSGASRRRRSSPCRRSLRRSHARTPWSTCSTSQTAQGRAPEMTTQQTAAVAVASRRARTHEKRREVRRQRDAYESAPAAHKFGPERGRARFYRHG